MVLNNFDIRSEIVDEDQLVRALSGKIDSYRSSHNISDMHLSTRMTGVVALVQGEGLSRPMIVVSRDEDHKRLFARLSQTRTDFSPLTSWCHLVNPELADRLTDFDLPASLGRLTSAWSGLVAAEAALVAGRSIGRIDRAACFATQSFVVARSAALWPHVRLSDLMERYDRAMACFSQRHDRLKALRERLSPIWAILLTLTSSTPVATERSTQAIARLLEDLLMPGRDEREVHQIVARRLHDLASGLPDIQQIADLPARARLEIYDGLLDSLRAQDRRRDATDYLARTLLCGYLTTILAGGEASYKTAEATAIEFPEILCWAYILGSLGERVTWTSGLDGLGRIIAREVERPLHLLEPPHADIAIEEAKALIDPGLSDPLVHLRLKSARSVLVSLYPGVTMTIQLNARNEEGPSTSSSASRNSPPPAETRLLSDALLATLVDALLPLLEQRLSGSGVSGSFAKTRSRAKQGSLPYSSRSKD